MTEIQTTDKQLGVIIPVYNEGENIGDTLQDLEDKVKTPHRIYIIYDFDEDNTLPEAAKFIDKGIDIALLKNPEGGVINAIKKGLLSASERYLLVSMADLSDDYSVVDKMVALMERGFDVVCGSRYMKEGRQIGGPVIKKTLSRLAGLSLKYIAGLPIHDVTNSFKLYRKKIFEPITLESRGGFEIGMEIVVKAYFLGFRVTELPCIWKDRKVGKSRFKILKWLPNYLRWYFYAVRKAFF